MKILSSIFLVLAGKRGCRSTYLEWLNHETFVNILEHFATSKVTESKKETRLEKQF